MASKFGNEQQVPLDTSTLTEYSPGAAFEKSFIYPSEIQGKPSISLTLYEDVSGKTLVEYAELSEEFSPRTSMKIVNSFLYKALDLLTGT